MSDTLRGKFFNATRGMFGDNSVKYMNIELGLTSTNYDDSGYGFDWGNRDRGSKLLASAILTKVGTPSVARIYSDKYTESVIQKFTQDSWSLEATEVAKWINSNTDYQIEINDEQELEAKAKEERKIQREKEFQEKIQEKLKEKEAKVKLEEEKKASEKSKNAINNYKIKLNKYQNEIEKQQIKIKKQEDEINEQNKQIEKYRELFELLDIPSLRKKFTTLDELKI